jgi:hypothetical protein
MHDFFNTIVIVVAILAFVWLRSTRGRDGMADRFVNSRRRDRGVISDGREGELEAEIAELHKRIAVLERIATDERKSRDIAAEIEALRGAPPAESRRSPAE